MQRAALWDAVRKGKHSVDAMRAGDVFRVSLDCAGPRQHPAARNTANVRRYFTFAKSPAAKVERLSGRKYFRSTASTSLLRSDRNLASSSATKA